MQYIWIFGYLAAFGVETKLGQETACSDMAIFFKFRQRNHSFRALEGIWQQFGTSESLDI